jgi:hypothetical protein
MGFQVSGKVKKILFGLVGVGIILMVAGIFTQKRYLFPEVHSPYHLDVVSNYSEFDQGALNDLKKEVEGALGEDYVVTIEDKSGVCTDPNHDHSHDAEGHDGGEEGHDHGDDHADHGHHGPAVLWHITIEEKAHDHGDDHAEGENHSGGHATEEHGHDDHAGHGHGGGHGHGINPAEELAAMFESGALSVADSDNRRLWSNLLINGFFFFGIALGALFYLGLHYATESGWGVVLLRVFEGISSAIWLGMAALLVVLLASTFGMTHIYPWMDSEIVNSDAIIYGKGAYLNKGFFWIRILAYFGVFGFFMLWFRKTSRKEDQEGGIEHHFKMYRRSALFLVFFAVFSSTMAWDIIMSIDTHWFSTLFGWYSFSGIWLSGMIMVMMITLYLKSKGALEYVNENHIHDVGKWMFAISFLWSYLWFSQFMLIWYSNIPEEVTYFIARFNDYKYIFMGMFAVNFVLPMVFFMSRDTKRSAPYLIVIGLIIFIGHWFDVFCMVMPGTVFAEWEYGMLEIGMFMAFLGGFLLLVFKGLASAPLVQKNHPYLQESIHHEF